MSIKVKVSRADLEIMREGVEAERNHWHNVVRYGPPQEMDIAFHETAKRRAPRREAFWNVMLTAITEALTMSNPVLIMTFEEQYG